MNKCLKILKEWGTTYSDTPYQEKSVHVRNGSALLPTHGSAQISKFEGSCSSTAFYSSHERG